MYTRCPSCRSEISFDAPSNLSNLPDGFKHRIKCPNCGVTIGVKIPRQESYLQVHPTYRPQNQNATSYEPSYQAASPFCENDAVLEDASDQAETGKKVKKPRRTARPRSAIMMLFSLIFVAFGIVGYLIAENILPVGNNIWLNGFAFFDGISVWIAVCTKSLTLGTNVLLNFLGLIPLLLFIFSAVHLIVSIFCLGFGKFSKLYNLTFGIIIGVLAVLIMFIFPLLAISQGATVTGSDIMETFKTLAAQKENYMMFVSGALGIVVALFTLVFTCMPMKPKKKKIEDGLEELAE